MWNPKRWRTRDGYIPYRVIARFGPALAALYAHDRLQVAQATRLAQAGKEGRSAWDAEIRVMRGEG